MSSSERDVLADGMMSIREAEAFSGLRKTSLYALMDRGLLPWTKIGKKRLVPRRALVDLLARELHVGTASGT